MDGSNNDPQVRQSHIATLLLANRRGGTDWGEYYQPDGTPWSKKIANTFLLCCSARLPITFGCGMEEWRSSDKRHSW